MPEEMDHLAHRAIFTTAKAKTNTGQVPVPRLKDFLMWIFFFFHCHRSFGEVHLGWESFKFLVGTSPFSEWPYTYLGSMVNGYHACISLTMNLGWKCLRLLPSQWFPFNCPQPWVFVPPPKLG